jgi:hypothetical protein
MFNRGIDSKLRGCDAAPTPKALAQASLQDAEIAKALRAGDLVMVVRHGATFMDQADTDPLNIDIATPPQPHTVTILITHQPNIIAALGKDWFDVKEGEASIFRPSSRSYKLLTRVQMDQCPRIAAAK